MECGVFRHRTDTILTATLFAPSGGLWFVFAQAVVGIAAISFAWILPEHLRCGLICNKHRFLAAYAGLYAGWRRAEFLYQRAACNALYQTWA